ncbi:hypothetical protein Csa_003509 [Cucumis sativus]|nr:hypothetical protein Csa_003509 [Cucumis sativus]
MAISIKSNLLVQLRPCRSPGEKKAIAQKKKGVQQKKQHVQNSGEVFRQFE